jgi:hypothetical protein
MFKLCPLALIKVSFYDESDCKLGRVNEPSLTLYVLMVNVCKELG